MVVPTMALYASPPSTVCSSPYDFELAGRPSTSPPSQKPIAGGISALFASSSSNSSELPLPSLRSEELSSSFSYSPYLGSTKREHNSPVSVLHGPISSSPPRESLDRRMNNRLFCKFVGFALGSCVDYDSPTFRVSEVEEEEELTFEMDESLEELGCGAYAKELLASAQFRHKVFHDDLVTKAFYEAEKAHRGQMRASGDPYLQHCVETAISLALIGANTTVVAAGLLHDTLDDSFMSYDDIFGTFGAGVADLVEGVSKLSHLSKLARESNTASRTVEADRLHTMFLAMADARAVLIKLADRLHNMMTLEALPLGKQKRFAKETMEVFVPLANRLGISSWKEQLENLCFKHLNPDKHKELSSLLVKSYNEVVVASSVNKLEQALKDDAVPYHVLSGRHKSLYSIYRKMLKKKLSMDEIHDIHGVRLIVDCEEDCYKALQIVHRLWSEVPGKFKDYISQPKFNGYQSLHTVVMSDGLVPVEVQIRTKEMHLQAECGFAAHWRYKEGDLKHSSYVLQMVEWARWVVTWQCETMIQDRTIGCPNSMRPPCTFPSHSDDCPYSYKPHCGHDGPVFVIMIDNDKMSVQEFPANSTVKDLLERAGRGSSRWTAYGFSVKEELRPKVNHEPVTDPDCKLKMGDVIDLTPTIPDESLTEYREEIQRMYDRGLSVSKSSSRPVAGSLVGRRG